MPPRPRSEPCAETALVGALSDTGRSSFKDFLLPTPNDPNRGLGFVNALNQDIQSAGNLQALASAIEAAQDFYTEFFYELLLQGRDSEFIELHVAPEVRQKLGTSYMNLGNDSWGNLYEFWMGPAPRILVNGDSRRMIIHRSYRVRDDAPSPNDPDFTIDDAFVWDMPTRNDFKNNKERFGLPPADNGDWNNLVGIAGYGFPAPKDLPVYIYSRGPNLVIDAVLPIQLAENDDFVEFFGGGDDPNNWDSEAGWDAAPSS